VSPRDADGARPAVSQGDCRAILTGANLVEANLSRADLTGAKLSWVTLQWDHNTVWPTGFTPPDERSA
jgi:uncharacterized protein YjbI with pentapeptide repeats